MSANFSNNSIAVIFDDHKMFADSFSSLLDKMEIFDTVQVFTEEKALVQFFKNASSKSKIYFFADYYLKDKHSLPVINDVKRIVKNLFVIVISSVTDPLAIQNILSFTPDGFLSKTSGFNEVLECIKDIENQNQYISPFIRNIIQIETKAKSIPFTAREIELLQYFNQGHSITSTAEKVYLSKHTIVAHRRRMMEKAGCRSIGELLAFSRKWGII